MKHFNRTLTFDEPTLVTHWPNGAASIGRKALVTVSADRYLIVS